MKKVPRSVKVSIKYGCHAKPDDACGARATSISISMAFDLPDVEGPYNMPRLKIAVARSLRLNLKLRPQVHGMGRIST